MNKEKQKTRSMHGFTLIECIMVIVILGVLSTVAMPRFIDLATSARSAAIQSLSGAVRTALGLVNLQMAVIGAGGADADPQLAWLTLADGTHVRMWNGYPDRWCDGVGAILQGSVTPTTGCYQSTAPVTLNQYTFYGYGNSHTPNGHAGWRMESAPNPAQCAVEYHYRGSAAPVVTAYTSGC